MARRSAPPNASPAFFSAPTPARRQLQDPNEGAFAQFMREQIWAPEKLPGNISILTGVGLFVGGIVAVRTWGELMIPA